MSCSSSAYASASGLSIGTLTTSSVYGGRLAEMSSNETNAPMSMRNRAEQQGRRTGPLLDPLGNLRFGTGVLLGFDRGDRFQDTVRLRETPNAGFAVFVALGHHPFGIDAIQDVEHVGGHAARQRAGEHDRLIDRRRERPECISLRGIGRFRFMHFIGDAEFEEVWQITADELNWCVAADSGSINLPERAVQRPPRFGLFSAAQGDRFQRLGKPLLLVEVVAQQPFVIEDNRTAAIRD